MKNFFVLISLVASSLVFGDDTHFFRSPTEPAEENTEASGEVEQKAEDFLREAQKELQKTLSIEQVQKATEQLRQLLVKEGIEKGIESAQQELQRILFLENSNRASQNLEESLKKSKKTPKKP